MIKIKNFHYFAFFGSACFASIELEDSMHQKNYSPSQEKKTTELVEIFKETGSAFEKHLYQSCYGMEKMLRSATSGELFEQLKKMDSKKLYEIYDSLKSEAQDIYRILNDTDTDTDTDTSRRNAMLAAALAGSVVPVGVGVGILMSSTVASPVLIGMAGIGAVFSGLSSLRSAYKSQAHTVAEGVGIGIAKSTISLMFKGVQHFPLDAVADQLHLHDMLLISQPHHALTTFNSNDVISMNETHSHTSGSMSDSYSNPHQAHQVHQVHEAQAAHQAAHEAVNKYNQMYNPNNTLDGIIKSAENARDNAENALKALEKLNKPTENHLEESLRFIKHDSEEIIKSAENVHAQHGDNIGDSRILFGAGNMAQVNPQYHLPSEKGLISAAFRTIKGFVDNGHHPAQNPVMHTGNNTDPRHLHELVNTGNTPGAAANTSTLKSDAAVEHLNDAIDEAIKVCKDRTLHGMARDLAGEEAALQKVLEETHNPHIKDLASKMMHDLEDGKKAILDSHPEDKNHFGGNFALIEANGHSYITSHINPWEQSHSDAMVGRLVGFKEGVHHSFGHDVTNDPHNIVQKADNDNHVKPTKEFNGLKNGQNQNTGNAAKSTEAEKIENFDHVTQKDLSDLYSGVDSIKELYREDNLSAMLIDHYRAINHLKKVLQEAHNPHIKDLASKMMDHLDGIREVILNAKKDSTLHSTHLEMMPDNGSGHPYIAPRIDCNPLEEENSNRLYYSLLKLEKIIERFGNDVEKGLDIHTKTNSLEFNVTEFSKHTGNESYMFHDVAKQIAKQDIDGSRALTIIYFSKVSKALLDIFEKKTTFYDIKHAAVNADDQTNATRCISIPPNSTASHMKSDAEGLLDELASNYTDDTTPVDSHTEINHEHLVIKGGSKLLCPEDVYPTKKTPLDFYEEINREYAVQKKDLKLLSKVCDADKQTLPQPDPNALEAEKRVIEEASNETYNSYFKKFYEELLEELLKTEKRIV